MSEKHIVMKDPAELRHHGVFAELHHPMLSTENAEWTALVADIQKHGIRTALEITPEGEILDGRHRHAVALEIGLPKVPCLVRTVEDPADAVICALMARRHYDQAARAWLLLPAFRKAQETGKRVRSNLPTVKKANVLLKSENSHFSGPTSATLCARHGISRDFFDLAVEVDILLDQLPEGTLITDSESGKKLDARAWVNLMLLDRQEGFTPVRRGLSTMAGKCQPEDLTDKRKEHGRLAAKRLMAFEKQFKDWGKTTEGQKKLFYKAVEEAVPTWPLDVCEALKSAIALRNSEITEARKAGLLK